MGTGYATCSSILPITNGPRYFTSGDAITDFMSASTAAARGIPDFSASTTASQNARICTATPRFVATFIAFAIPSGPTWVIPFGPIAARYGRTRSSAAASPPTWIDATPCPTGPVLPGTGASSMIAPLAATAAPSSRVTSGPTVLISTKTAPRRSPATTPSGPSATARSASLSVTIVKTTSAAAAASRGVFAIVMPAATSARAVHALLHHYPVAVVGDHKTVQIKIKTVLHRGAVDGHWV